jgi:enoyl-CoA hydratase/carnithine racemase
MYETILFDVRDAVATITLNRPEKRNAYTPQMGVDVVDAFGRARDDDDVRVVILTGAGKGFCGGVDLDLLKQSRSGEGSPGKGPALGTEAFINSFPLELLRFPKPVIAAINGAAIGVGVTMTLPCDFRIAAEGAKLGLTFAQLGILPGLGSTHLLPRLVGIANANDLVLTARVILADEAARMGLVNRVVPGDKLIDEARELAAAMAALRPEVLAATKAALLYGSAASMEEAMKNEAAASASLRSGRP